MTDEEIFDSALDLLGAAVQSVDADHWWAIEQLAGSCREHPWLPSELVGFLEEWIDEDEPPAEEWMTVADTLTHLGTRWPDPEIALVWWRLATEREDEVSRHVQEADRLAALSDEPLLRASIDGQGAFLLAGAGHGREALDRARRHLQEHGPDQSINSLVADLLEEEETASAGASWASAALQDAEARGETLEDDLRESWSRLHWKWLEGMADDPRHRREMTGILTEIAAHADWLGGERPDLYATGFARLSVWNELNDLALGWLGRVSDDCDDPFVTAEAAVLEVQALVGLARGADAADAIRRHGEVVARVGDAEQRSRLAVCANAIARTQLDWEGAERLLDLVDPEVISPDLLAIHGELDQINRRLMRHEAKRSDIDELLALAERSAAAGSADTEQMLTAHAATIATGLRDPRSHQLRLQADFIAVSQQVDTSQEMSGAGFMTMLSDLAVLGSQSNELMLERIYQLRSLPGVEDREGILLIFIVACAYLEVSVMGRYRDGLESVTEGLRVCDVMVRAQRSSRERARLRHMQLDLVELGLVAAEALRDKRAIAELIEFQRYQSMPVAKQEMEADDVPFDRISVILSGGADAYAPDDADVTFTVVPTRLPWESRFATAGEGAALQIPR